MSLHVITGPMRAGKTAELIRIAHDAYRQGAALCVFVHQLGADAENEILRSRNGQTLAAVAVSSATDMVDIINALGVQHRACVVIDEAQFFDETEVPEIELLSLWHDVHVAGLDSDFRGEPFPVMQRLMRRAIKYTWLKATCARCGAPATRTQRLIDGKPAPWDSPVILPGGDDMYEPRCVECHEVPGRPGVSIDG